MFGKGDVAGFLGGEDDTVCALFESGFELESVSNGYTSCKFCSTKGMTSAGCVWSLCASSSL